MMNCDFWFTSASAVTESGEMIFVDASVSCEMNNTTQNKTKQSENLINNFNFKIP